MYIHRNRKLSRNNMICGLFEYPPVYMFIGVCFLGIKKSSTLPPPFKTFTYGNIDCNYNGSSLQFINDRIVERHAQPNGLSSMIIYFLFINFAMNHTYAMAG